MTMTDWRKQNPHKAAEHSRKQRERNPEKMRRFSRASYKRHKISRQSASRAAYQEALVSKPDKVKKHSRTSWLGWKYGITVEEYERKYESQKGCCAICGKPFAALCVDHNHETLTIRDLLCRLCNMRVGWIEKDIVAARTAFEYVLRWKS